ncbi:MAG: N-acetyltransferase [Acidobacteria bacterium]|nr:MAG: N-acetyltransferase [Acidobacteriota bacterium]
MVEGRLLARQERLDQGFFAPAASVVVEPIRRRGRRARGIGAVGSLHQLRRWEGVGAGMACGQAVHRVTPSGRMTRRRPLGCPVVAAARGRPRHACPGFWRSAQATDRGRSGSGLCACSAESFASDLRRLGPRKGRGPGSTWFDAPPDGDPSFPGDDRPSTRLRPAGHLPARTGSRHAQRRRERDPESAQESATVRDPRTPPRPSIRPERFRVRFVRATAEDADRVADLARRTFSDAFAHRNPEADFAAYLEQAFRPERIRRELSDPAAEFLLGLVVPGAAALPDVLRLFTEQPFGYCKLVHGRGNDSVPAARPLELQRIYVEQAAIGHGLGTRILEEALLRGARGGHDWIWLCSWDSNDDANRFYQRHGFRLYGFTEFVLGSDRQIDRVLARRLPRTAHGAAARRVPTRRGATAQG